MTGGFLEPGPAMVWMRSRVPLVAGEPTSPLQRVLIAADAGNGVSAALDWRRYLFINTDLSVHLKRLPEGDWVGLDAVTYPEPNGIGLADTRAVGRARAAGPRRPDARRQEPLRASWPRRHMLPAPQRRSEGPWRTTPEPY